MSTPLIITSIIGGLLGVFLGVWFVNRQMRRTRRDDELQKRLVVAAVITEECLHDAASPMGILDLVAEDRASRGFDAERGDIWLGYTLPKDEAEVRELWGR